MWRALVLLAVTVGALALPPMGHASSQPCPIYEHDQYASPDGAYFVTYDRIFCRDASTTRHQEILVVTQGDPHANDSVVVLRVEHTWLRDSADAWWGSTASANVAGANVTAGANDIGGACAAKLSAKKDAFGAGTGTPAIPCVPPWMTLI